MNDFLKNNIAHFENVGNNTTIIDQARENNKCPWSLIGKCEGNFYNVGIFGKQITIPMCESHFIQHLILMSLANFTGKSIDDFLKLELNELVDTFEQTFGTKEINRNIFLKLIEKKGYVGDLQNITDEEMFEKIGRII